jgi:hypothetical protein
VVGVLLSVVACARGRAFAQPASHEPALKAVA